MYFNAQYSHLVKSEEISDEEIPLLKDDNSKTIENKVLERAHIEWNIEHQNTFSTSSEHKTRNRSGESEEDQFRGRRGRRPGRLDRKQYILQILSASADNTI